MESGPAVRRKAASVGRLRSVGMIAWVAIGRPRPSAVVKRAVKMCLPAAIKASSSPAVSVPSREEKSMWSRIAFSDHGASSAAALPTASTPTNAPTTTKRNMPPPPTTRETFMHELPDRRW